MDRNRPLIIGICIILLTLDLQKGYVQCRSTYYNSRYKVPWTTAKVDCERIGGYLLKVDDDAEYAYFQSRRAYMGLAGTHLLIGLRADAGGVKWTDGTLLSLNDEWSKSGQIPSSPKCGYLSNGQQLYPLACSGQQHFVCEVEEGTEEARLKADVRSCWMANDLIYRATDENTEDVYNYQCPRGKVYFSPSHRLNPMTWPEAEAYCKKGNGILAKITSEEEQLIVDRFRRVKNLGKCWTGGNDIATEGQYKWSDGEVLEGWPEFTKWTEPAADTTKNCAVTGSTEWPFEDCATKYPILCEMDLAQFPRHQSCLWNMNHGYNWEYNQARCIENGAHHPHIKTMRHWMRMKLFHGTIGVIDVNRDGNFTWTDGTMMTWSRWFSNQPSSADGSEPYGVLYSGVMSLKTTTATMHRTCERNVFQFRHAYVVHTRFYITVKCHKYCPFPDNTMVKDFYCLDIDITSDDQQCICSDKTWSILEPWLSHLDTTALQDDDNTTCLSTSTSIHTLTVTNSMIFTFNFEVDIFLSPDTEHLCSDVLRVFTTTDLTSPGATCQLSGALTKCKHISGPTYACKCTAACRVYVKVFQPGPSTRTVTVCDIDFFFLN